MSEEVAELLDKAHDALLIDGWCQREMHDKAGAHCIEGALFAADPRCGTSPKTFVNAEHAIARELGNRAIIIWNDTPGRTIDDVLDVLRHAAKAERA